MTTLDRIRRQARNFVVFIGALWLVHQATIFPQDVLTVATSGLFLAFTAWALADLGAGILAALADDAAMLARFGHNCWLAWRERAS